MGTIAKARVVELVDTQDLKSCSPQRECGFESRPGHLLKKLNPCKSMICKGFLFHGTTAEQKFKTAIILHKN